MPILDKYEAYPDNLLSAPTNALNITPSDTEELPFITRSITVGTGGNIAIVPEDQRRADTAVIYKAVSGQTIILRATKIKATGTDASDIVIQN